METFVVIDFVVVCTIGDLIVQRAQSPSKAILLFGQFSAAAALHCYAVFDSA